MAYLYNYTSDFHWDTHPDIKLLLDHCDPTHDILLDDSDDWRKNEPYSLLFIISYGYNDMCNALSSADPQNPRRTYNLNKSNPSWENQTHRLSKAHKNLITIFTCKSVLITN